MMPCADARRLQSYSFTACKVDEAYCVSHRDDQVEAMCFDPFDLASARISSRLEDHLCSVLMCVRVYVYVVVTC